MDAYTQIAQDQYGLFSSLPLGRFAGEIPVPEDSGVVAVFFRLADLPRKEESEKLQLAAVSKLEDKVPHLLSWLQLSRAGILEGYAAFFAKSEEVKVSSRSTHVVVGTDIDYDSIHDMEGARIHYGSRGAVILSTIKQRYIDFVDSDVIT